MTWAPRLPLSPSPAINPATGRGRCVASVGGARPAGLPFLDGDGAGRVGARRRPVGLRVALSDGGGREPCRACIAAAHSGIRSGFGRVDSGLLLLLLSFRRRHRRISTVPYVSTRGCRMHGHVAGPDGWNDEIAFLADRAVLPRREEWRRTTSATSPVLKKKIRLLYITS